MRTRTHTHARTLKPWPLASGPLYFTLPPVFTHFFSILCLYVSPLDTHTHVCAGRHTRIVQCVWHPLGWDTDALLCSFLLFFHVRHPSFTFWHADLFLCDVWLKACCWGLTYVREHFTFFTDEQLNTKHNYTHEWFFPIETSCSC